MRSRLFVVLVSGLMVASSHAMAASGVITPDTGPSYNTTTVDESPELPEFDENAQDVGGPGKGGFVPGPWAAWPGPFANCMVWGGCFGPFVPFIPKPRPYFPGYFPGPCACNPVYWDHAAEGGAHDVTGQHEDLNDPVLDEEKKKLNKAFEEAKVEFYEELYEELYGKDISDKDFQEMFEEMSEDEKKKTFKGYYPFPTLGGLPIPPTPPVIPGYAIPCGIPCGPFCGFPGPCGPFCGFPGPCGPFCGGPIGIWGGGFGWGGGLGLLPEPCNPYPTFGLPFYDQEQAEQIQTEDPTTLAI